MKTVPAFLSKLFVVGGVITAGLLLWLNLNAASVSSPEKGRPPGANPDGMVWIPGGDFLMGNDAGPPQMEDMPTYLNDEAPAHLVELDGFWMDETEVTNRQFLEFVEATGYVTIAEKKPKREDFIGQIPDV